MAVLGRILEAQKHDAVIREPPPQLVENLGTAMQIRPVALENGSGIRALFAERIARLLKVDVANSRFLQRGFQPGLRESGTTRERHGADVDNQIHTAHPRGTHEAPESAAGVSGRE